MRLAGAYGAFIVALAALGACASSSSVSVTHKLDDSADAPYEKTLVITLFDSFDSRRYLEDEIVKQLAERGAVGVASTSMMNTKTPLVAQTFMDMVKDIGADAVLLTQLTSHEASLSERARRPQATYNYWPTHYYNVFQVELTEYIEPGRVEAEHSLVLATQIYSVQSREPVWGMESSSVFVEIQEDGLEYDIYVDEAAAIVRHLLRDDVVVR